MESFLFSLEATIPIFLVMILGYILKRTHFFTEGFIQVADKYVFKVALPVLLFEQVATADIHKDFQWEFVVFCMVVTTIMFGVIWLMARIFMKDKDSVGAFAQAAARGSAAILGIAFIENIYGNSGLGPLMIISAVPLYNIYSVIILTVESRNKLSGKGALKKALIGVATNPIIIGILLGIPFALFHVSIPTIPMKAIHSIAVTATPVALLVVGAGFEGRKALKKLRPTIWATLIKLVLLPACFLPVALWMGFKREALVAIIVMLGSPTTVTCYIMAKNMDNDEVLSSSVVMLATLVSSVTLTLWIFLMRSQGWI